MNRSCVRKCALLLPLAAVPGCSLGPAAPDDTTVATVAFAVDGGVISLGEGRQLIPTFRNGAGTVLAPITDYTWHSSDTTIVAVDRNGRAFGRALGGPVTITLSARGRSGTATARVVPNRVDIAPQLTSLAIGNAAQLTGSAVDFAGVAIGAGGGSVVWASSDARVASIDAATGLLTALGPGEAEITATAAGRTSAMHIETGVPSAYDGSWAGGSDCSDCQYATTYPIEFDILFGSVRNFRMTIVGPPPLAQCAAGIDPILLTPPISAPNAVIADDHFDLPLQMDVAEVSGTFTSPATLAGTHTAMTIPITCRSNINPVPPLHVAAAAFAAAKKAN